MIKQDKIYILEEYNSGTFYAYKSWDRAFRELLTWYANSGLDDLASGLKDELHKKYPNINWENDSIIDRYCGLIKGELATAIDHGYIDSFGYISEAQVQD